MNVTRTTEIRHERFEIVDKDGKRQVYHSLIRALYEGAQRDRPS